MRRGCDYVDIFINCGVIQKGLVTVTVHNSRIDMRYSIIVVSALSLMLSCGQDVKKESPKGVVTVIFKDAPEQRCTDKVGRLNSAYESIVTYVDSEGREAGFNPRSIGLDTLDVPTYRGYAEILHLYQVCEMIPYLLIDGDTVIVTYDHDSRSKLKSLHVQGYTGLYNFPGSVPGMIHRNGYSLKTILNNNRFKAAEKYLTDPESQRKYPGVQNRFREYYVNLDSVADAHNNWRDRFSAKLDSLSETGEIGLEYSRWYKLHLLEDGYDIGLIKQSDSLLHYVTHLHKLMEYPEDNYHAFDFTGRFDFITQDTSLCTAARKALLSHYISRINNTGWSPYPSDVVNEYNEKYFRLTGDSSFSQPALEKPNVASVDGYTYDLILQDISGKSHRLDEIIKSHRGKAIYTDIWASWCGPCRREMLSSKRLRERLDSEKVIFLYISTDRSESDWKRSVKELGLENNGENYRITSEESDFLKEIKLRYIPRYLIFDKNGRLVDLDAPSPSSKEAEKKLNQVNLRKST